MPPKNMDLVPKCTKPKGDKAKCTETPVDDVNNKKGVVVYKRQKRGGRKHTEGTSFSVIGDGVCGDSVQPNTTSPEVEKKVPMIGCFGEDLSLLPKCVAEAVYDPNHEYCGCPQCPHSPSTLRSWACHDPWEGERSPSPEICWDDCDASP